VLEPGASIESPRTSPDPRDVRLPLARKIVYGAGELAVGIRLSSFGFVLFPFYTDVVLLPPALVGAALAIGRVWDGLNDPVMGWISDRTRTRWGRRRPYLGTMILPLAAGFR
jgi:GPH family glycoside/pentoside/hexuronide:cation symporter